MSGRGSAVLVHGGWGNPEDWRWVRQLLESAGVHVEAPDLPSHRSADAGLEEDAEEARQAIRACPAPVVAVGWSYGGAVIGAAVTGEPSVIRLLYVAAIPWLPDGAPADLSWLEDPHILVGGELTSWTMSGGSTKKPEPHSHRGFSDTFGSNRAAR